MQTLLAPVLVALLAASLTHLLGQVAELGFSFAPLADFLFSLHFFDFFVFFDFTGISRVSEVVEMHLVEDV